MRTLSRRPWVGRCTALKTDGIAEPAIMLERSRPCSMRARNLRKNYQGRKLSNKCFASCVLMRVINKPAAVSRCLIAAAAILVNVIPVDAASSSFSSRSTNHLQLATFSADLTVPLGHGMMGGSWLSKSIADPLEANGFVLLGRENPVVFVSIVWCEILNDDYRRRQNLRF